MADATTTIDPATLYASLASEVARITGVSRIPLLRRLVPLAVRRPLLRFCQAFAETDRIMGPQGFPAAARWLVTTWFARDVSVRGLAHVPVDGPLLVASNHPGGIDSPSLSAALERQDLKIIASGVTFLKLLPTIRQHLIFIADDAVTRMTAIRQAIRHLEGGGALLVFPTGLVEPDPGWMPGAEERLQDWSGSLEIFLRKVPGVRLLPAVTSEVLHPTYARHPLARLYRVQWKRLRMAEVLQIVDQLSRPGRLRLEPKISFGQPRTLAELEALGSGRRLRDAILAIECDLIREHRSAFYGGAL